MKKIITLFALLAVSFLSQSQIIINEVLYDPPSGSAGDANGDGTRDANDDEFIEFVNTSTTSLDLSGYELYDGLALRTATPRHIFPAGSILGPDSALVIFGGGNPTGNFGTAQVVVATTGIINLSNNGDTITLKDSLGNVVLTLDIEPWSNNPDESYTRFPDITGSFIQHADTTTLLFSPGTYVDGVTPFVFNNVLVSSITVSGANGLDSINTLGGTLQMQATVNPTNATNTTVTWSLNPISGVATINSVGLLTATNDGIVWVIASANDASGVKDSIQVFITNQTPPISQVIINEVLYDPASGSAGDANGDGFRDSSEDEFIEFVNTSNSSYDMSGFEIYDALGLKNGIPRHIFPAGTVVGRDSAIVVFGGGSPTGYFGTAIIDTSSSGDLNLSNAGDTITIKDNLGYTILTLDIEPWSNNPDESYTRFPDLTGVFIQHSDTTPLLFSPGTYADGITPFGAVANVLVSNISVNGINNIDTITALNGTLQMQAMVMPSNATNNSVTWSLNPATGLASISSTGLITAINDGNVWAIASANDSSGVKDSLLVSISNQTLPPILVNAIIISSLNGSDSIKTLGGSLQMIANVSPSNATDTTVTWSLNPNSGIATINATGLLSASTDGNVWVIASANDASGKKDSLQVNISNQIPPVSQVIINEVLYDPPSGLAGDANRDGTRDPNDDEFIEFVNTSNSSYDMSGFELYDGLALKTGVPRHVFPAGTVVGKDSAIVVFGGGIPTGVFGTSIVDTATGGALNLSNNGDTITLKDNLGNVILTLDIEPWSNNPDESYTRFPDLTGGFIQHSDTTSLLFSPGTYVDGITPFGPVAKVLVSSITVQGAGGVNSISIPSGTLQMQVTISPSNATNTSVSWSLNPATGIATIDSSGLLSAVNDGNIWVIASALDSSGVKDSVQISITNQTLPIVLVSSISVSGSGGATSITTNNGSLQMEATVLPSNATDSSVTWSINPTMGIATISSTGLLNAINNGNVWVIASANDASGVKDSIQIAINNQSAPVSKVIINEVLYDPPSGTDGDANRDGTRDANEDEFIEFVNTSSSSYDMSGFEIYDALGFNTSTPRHVFPAGTVIGKDSAIVIFGGGTPTGSFGVATVQTASSGALNMTNSGDSIILTDNLGNILLVLDIEPWSNNPDESYTRFPDLTGDFIQHADTTPLLFSPGTYVDGVTPFGNLLTVLVSSIAVQGTNGENSIENDDGTLQMEATVLPVNATNKNVTWLINPASGIASISSSGLLTAAADGDVWVIAKANDASGIQDSVKISISNQIVSVKEIALRSFKIYPNPTSNILFIEAAEKINLIEIFSLDGRLVKTENVVLNSINISELNDGIYLMSVTSSNTRFFQRIIKK
jgi:uncharacterized protein YjdB